MTRRRSYSTSTYIRQRGLSLIEVMVAMGIGLLLIAGVTQLFIGSNQNFIVKESVSRMQEDVRFAMDQFQRDMRMAGFQGCARDVTDHLNPAGAEFNQFLLGSTPVFGWDYAFNGTLSGAGSQHALLEMTSAGSNWVAAAPGPLANNTLPANFDDNFQPGSDVFVVNLGEVHNVQVIGVTNPPNARINLTAGTQLPVINNRVVVVASGDCTVADRFQRTNDADDSFVVKGDGGPGDLNNGADPFSSDYLNNATLIEYRSWVYFVRSTAAGPELARRQIGPGTGGAAIETVVQGVENMQVLYGVSTGGLRNRVNQYVPANDVADWDDVLSVRIALLLRTTEPVNPDTNFRIFNLLGTQINPSGANWDDIAGDRHIRLMATTTIGLRNRLE
ncbi:MAG: PilW family protein [Natronospirillum sp.]